MPDLLDRLKTALPDRYAIQEELGAGGMATVYLAHNVRVRQPRALWAVALMFGGLSTTAFCVNV